MLSTPFEVKNKVSGSEGIAVSEHFSLETTGELDANNQLVKIPVHWFTVLYYDCESPVMTLASELEWLSVPGITDDESEDSDESDGESEDSDEADGEFEDSEESDDESENSDEIDEQ